ncbi:MAG: ATPase, T2SS/T4P/T4SS family [Eubacteriales bacterium]|nr:ATPase, T2SS/T4P/T4SS family [Eubacteriales bacterium]
MGIYKVKITSANGLSNVEKKYRAYQENELIPFARNTSYVELAERVLPDKDGPWIHPLILFQSSHVSTIGANNLCKKIKEFLDEHQEESPTDILSISAGMDGDHLCAVVLIRAYKELPNIVRVFDFLGEKNRRKVKPGKSSLKIPETAKFHYTDAEREAHRKALEKQNEIYENATEEQPFLNQIEHYVKRELPEIDDSRELIYDLLRHDMMLQTKLPYQDFIQIFQTCMRYASTVEKDTYYAVIRGSRKKEDFDLVMSSFIEKTFLQTEKLPREDLPALNSKLNRALFELYIVQDLIDDPKISDVKITAPDSIRVRVGGKAYLSNVTFIGVEDYIRFVKSVAVKNNIDLRIPSQTFTDEHDSQYILRYTITAPYVTSTGFPIIHIRKEAKKKLMSDDLIRLGMMDEKIRDYLIDRGRDRDAMGIVFAGPPQSGKTVMLNWFMEDAYEQSAEILVIQENDELFAYRKGVMVEHVVNYPQKGEQACTLESLGQLALVTGADVFIIGEAKGAEICSAITLSNSGCRTAITIHSPSSTQTIDKMADLAMRGAYVSSYEQAMRMIVSFKTIVYLQDFKVQEISEVVGWSEEKKAPIYRVVYRRENAEK